jgi:hypothetical protein
MCAKWVTFWRAASKALGVLRPGIWMISNLGLEENAILSLETEETERTLVRTVGPLGIERSCWRTCWETCPFPPVTSNRDPVDNPTPKKIPPFYTKNPYFRSIISKQLLVRIIYLSKVAIRSSKNLII